MSREGSSRTDNDGQRRVGCRLTSNHKTHILPYFNFLFLVEKRREDSRSEKRPRYSPPRQRAWLNSPLSFLLKGDNSKFCFQLPLPPKQLSFSQGRSLCRAYSPARMRCTRHLILLVAFTLAVATVFVSAQQQAVFEHNQGDGNAGKKSAADYLKQGTVAMSTGKFADAIGHFNEAILLDPDNYLSYYRRATAALSLGRSSSAMSDFDKIIDMNPKFAQAYLQRAKLLTKDGRLDRAKESVDQYLKLKKDDKEGKELKKTIEGTASNLKALKKTKEAIDKSLQKGKNITTDASLATKVDGCMRLASLVLEVSPSSLEARRDRADCALAKGEHEDAIADWT